MRSFIFTPKIQRIMDGKDLADYIVDKGVQLGASYVEVRYLFSVDTSITLNNGNVLAAGSDDGYGIGVRIIANGGLGFFSLNKMEISVANRALEKSIRLAKNSGRSTDPVEFVEMRTHADSWKVNYQTRLTDISPEEKLEWLQNLHKEIQNEDWKTKVADQNILYGDTVEDKYLITSEGTKIQSDFQRIILNWSFKAINSSNGQTESRFTGVSRTSGWEFMNEKTESTVLNDIREVTEATASATKYDFDSEVDFVISSEIQGIISHENSGHPQEADRILGREGAEAGESYIQEHTLGESVIGSEELTIIDDPTILGSGGFYIYDDEGMKARKRELIKNGLLNELLHNRETAKIYGLLESNAASRASAYNREPIIRMANTGFAPGSYTGEEIFEDVKEGIFLKNFSEWNIDDRRFQCLYKGISALLIKDGEVTNQYIRRPTLEVTTNTLLKSVDAVTKDGFGADAATCGKGNPMQGCPVWTFGNELARLRNVPVRF